MTRAVRSPLLAVTAIDCKDPLRRIDAVPRHQGELSAPFLERFIV